MFFYDTLILSLYIRITFGWNVIFFFLGKYSLNRECTDICVSPILSGKSVLSSHETSTWTEFSVLFKTRLI